MKVLVTGATGTIGRAICERMAAKGHSIVVLTRRPENARVVPGAQAFRWDAEREHPPIEAWDGVDAVVHLAGEPVAGARWTDEQKKRIRDSRILGTRNLVEGMRALQNPPRILISASAVGFYGNRGDEQLDENSNPGQGYLTDVCRQWESESERAREFGARVVLVRIGVVLSPTGGALEKMLLPFKLGLGGRLGSGRQWFPWVHIDDIVGIFLHAVENPAVNGPVNGAAPGIVTNEVFTRQFAAVLHRPVFFPVPEFALRLLMGEMAAVVLASQRVLPQATLASGYQFKFPDLTPALVDVLNQS